MTPVPMDHHEKARLRAAAFRVTRLYPGPVGELLSRELLTWEEFGYRLGGGTGAPFPPWPVVPMARPWPPRARTTWFGSGMPAAWKSAARCY